MNNIEVPFCAQASLLGDDTGRMLPAIEREKKYIREEK
jgi:hypothetical protein